MTSTPVTPVLQPSTASSATCLSVNPLSRQFARDSDDSPEKDRTSHAGLPRARGVGQPPPQVDRSARQGPRDYLLLALLYDTRVPHQELLDMKPADFHLPSPPFVRILGKGRKERLCPLLTRTTSLVSRFFETQGYAPGDDQPVFQNRRGQKLTRQGAPLSLEEISSRRSQGDAEPQPSWDQSAHTSTHESHAPSPVWCADYHDQRCTRPCNRQVHGSLCPD